MLTFADIQVKLSFSLDRKVCRELDHNGQSTKIITFNPIDMILYK